jgi:hypothetical protein
VPSRLALRHRQQVLRSLRWAAGLLGAGLLVLVATVGPTLLLWWNTPVPAAIGTAIFALVLLSVVVFVPLEALAYVSLYFDRPVELPRPGRGFGRRLYRECGRLDALADAAGLRLVSDFASADPLHTGQPPVWHRPDDLLPTLARLLAAPDLPPALAEDVRYLHAALRLAADRGARFYLILLTCGGMTNAEIEARRRAA